jgi:hypothetical protein
MTQDQIDEANLPELDDSAGLPTGALKEESHVDCR